jgi:hypothetical protein
MNSYLRASAAVLAVLLVPTTTVAATVPTMSAVAAPAAETVVLKLGTAVPMKTTAEMTSKKTKVGERFALVVASDVVVGGQVVIPAGATGVGEVVSVTKKGAFGRSGKIQVRVLYVDVGSTRIELTGTFDTAGKGNTTGTGVAAVAVGVFSAFVTGKSAIIAPGTEINGYAAKDTDVQAVGAAAAAAN